MATIRPEVTGRKGGGRNSKNPLSQRLDYTIGETAQLLGLGRNATYEAAKRGDIFTIRMGRLLLVPKGPLHKLVGAESLASWTSGEAAEPVDVTEERSEETEQ